jgi:ADP-ribosylglycohydrolase
MAALLMEHYKRYGRLDIPMLTLSYRFWAKEEGHADGIGIQTASVLLDGSRDKSSQGNGALMRSVPFGVWLTEMGFGFEEAVARMNEDAAITHANEMVFLANRLALVKWGEGKKVIEPVVMEYEDKAFDELPYIEQRAIELVKQDRENAARGDTTTLAREYLTRYSNDFARAVVDRWWEMGDKLWVKMRWSF